RDDPLKVTIDTHKLPEGWTVEGEDTLGELYLGLLTTPPAERKGLSANAMAVLGVKYTNKASTGWGGDRLVLLQSGDRRYVELVTAWDSQKDAEEFCSTFQDAEHPIFVDATKAGSLASKGSYPVGTPWTTYVECKPGAEAGPWVVVIKVISAPD